MAREQTVRILAEMVANVIVVEVAVDDRIAAGDAVCLLESMKMEIPVLAEVGGVVTAIGGSTPAISSRRATSSWSSPPHADCGRYIAVPTRTDRPEVRRRIGQPHAVG